MNKEKKTLRGTTTEQKGASLDDASLDDASLEAVSGGGRSKQWLADVQEWVQSLDNSNNVTEQQP